MLCNYYTLFNFFAPLIASGKSYISISTILALCAILLAFFTWVGLGIRAGKSWAKVLAVTYFAWSTFLIARQIPTLTDYDINYWAVLRNLFSLTMFLSICYFLFRHNFIRRSAA